MALLLLLCKELVCLMVLQLEYVLFLEKAWIKMRMHRIIVSDLCLTQTYLNASQNDKVLDWSKFKALADDKINVTENLKFVLGRVENFEGKGENAGYQDFYRVFKSHDCV